MITYILESLAFQLLFLLTYDLFLKKETFFQWNRAYLLATFVLSILLPWIKIEALQTTMPKELETTTVFLTQLDGVVIGPDSPEVNFLASVPWPYLVMAIGAILAALWFVFKILQLSRLKSKSKVEHYPDYTKVIMPQSSSAFSFFRSIFMGAQIKKDKEANILAHEMVHVKQKHTLDLLFFELARIVFWFNPLVYIYQNRIAELHEFIADEKAVKQNKQAHFEMLLSEAFHTQNISFVNQFFTKSLIKKRIVMLQKKKSKAVWQLKYVLLMPLVLGMLIYTSCESELKANNTDEVTSLENGVNHDDKNHVITLKVGDIASLTHEEKDMRAQILKEIRNRNEESILEIVDKENRKVKIQLEQENRKINIYVDGDTSENKVGGISVPFAVIDEVPVFPGCEDAEDKRACFQEKIQEHIRKNFNYPKAAQELGIQGRVSSIFTIDAGGNIVDINMRGPHEILEEETQRILSKLPQMEPGKHKGEAVKVPFSIPIVFKLDAVKQESYDQETKISVPFATIDEVPVFPGCEGAVDKRKCFNEKIVEHIKKHFNYPEEAKEKGVQGRVSVVFTIDANGEISTIKKRGPDVILENEAERIIKRLPKMQPGKHKGETVKVPFAIPITFRLKSQTNDANKQEDSQKEEMKVGGILDNRNNTSLFIGKVTDHKSMGIPGVTISVVGKDQGVISNFSGHFEIAVEQGEVLSFQYIGLPNKLVRVDKKEFLMDLMKTTDAENKG
ncbi:TonB family protein [Allomuricauda sp.]|uniref:TonB family protein n=1 Tax=Flagellimonas alginolytica TaxID=3177515 RepID=UPI0025F65485|nr:TonB family protein [Allomuricauda sp.]